MPKELVIFGVFRKHAQFVQHINESTVKAEVSINFGNQVIEVLLRWLNALHFFESHFKVQSLVEIGEDTAHIGLFCASLICRGCNERPQGNEWIMMLHLSYRAFLCSVKGRRTDRIVRTQTWFKDALHKATWSTIVSCEKRTMIHLAYFQRAIFVCNRLVGLVYCSYVIVRYMWINDIQFCWVHLLMGRF